MYEHQIVLDTLAAFDLGSHENGMLLHQSREPGLGAGGGGREMLLQVEHSKEFNPEPQQSESSLGHSWGMVSL